MVGSAVCGLMFVQMYSTVINDFVMGISVKECMILALRGDYFLFSIDYFRRRASLCHCSQFVKLHC